MWGPRKTEIRLLLIGSMPVFLVGLAKDYTTFLLFRGAIGIIGASFVITQFHTSLMFAPNIKGTANAVAGGWGNLGGGVTNMVMPLIFAAIVGLGYTKSEAWRYAMIVPGIMMLIAAYLYYRFTKDTPAGNFDELPAYQHKRKEQKTDWSILSDWRIWALTLAYAMCFGMCAPMVYVLLCSQGLPRIMFGSVVLRKSANKKPGKLKSLERYDILYTKDFNPNSAELILYRERVEKDHIATYLISLCKMFYEKQSCLHDAALPVLSTANTTITIPEKIVYQCNDCLTVYDHVLGDSENDILAGTAFDALPDNYCCALCGAPKNNFSAVDASALSLPDN